MTIQHLRHMRHLRHLRHLRRATLPVALALLLGLGFLAPGLSCKVVGPGPESTEPKPQYLKTGEVQLVMSRLGTFPRRLVTSGDRVSVRFFFDPQLVDVRKADRYALWRLDPSLRIWKRLGSVKADGTPLVIEPEEGLHALRASVIYADGGERLVPQVGDAPALHLLVDRTPPSFVWIEPKESTPIAGLWRLDLKWAANEAQFGDEPVRLEWSADRGRTWKPIATVRPANGHQSYRWRLPEDVCSDILVRVAASDLSGHEGAASIALAYPGSLAADGSPLARRETPAADATLSRGAAPQEGPSPEDTSQGVAPQRAQEDGRDAVAVVPMPSRGPAPADPQTPRDAGRAVAAVPPTPRDSGGGMNEPGTGPLRLAPLQRDFVRGGAELPVRWTYEGKAPDATAPEATVRVEWSRDGGSTWAALGESSLAEGSFRWNVPSASEEGNLLRILALSPKGWRLEARSDRPFAIDSDPPRIALGALPAVVGPEVELPVALSDPGGSGIDRVEAYVRPTDGRPGRPADGTGSGGASWRPLGEGSVLLDTNLVKLDLSDLEEGAYELALRAFDRVGNASESPFGEPGAGAGGSGAGADPASGSAAGPTQDGDASFTRVAFQLDRTPPAIRATRGPSPWVSGFLGDADVVVDWADAVPPLVVEGSADDGRSWTEIGRWTEVSENRRVAFDIPGDVRAYAVRFSVADPVGNVGRSTVGPEKVAPPIRLRSFLAGKAYPEGSLEKIEWELDPAAHAIASSLTVSVAHFQSASAGWELLYEVAPDKHCLWEIPPADNQTHQIRVRILKGAMPLGEDISPSFTIVGDGARTPVAVNISEDSLLYSRRARESMDRYFTMVAGGRSPFDSTEMQNLRKSIAEDFAKAIRTDPKNYHATYGYAQLLNRLDATGNADEVRGLLEKTLAIQPAHAWALNDLGALAIRDGKYAEAEGYLARAVAIEASPVIQYNLGLALFFGEKPKEARGALETALAQSSRGGVADGEIYYYMIQCLAREGDVKAAQGLFQEKREAIPAELRADLAAAGI